MALQYSTPIRNAMLEAYESTIGVSAKLRLYSGSVPANPAATIGAAVLLVEMILPSDWAANAASGVKALTGTWSGVAVAGAGATPTFFRIWDSTGTTCGIQGTAGIGAGDMQANGTITTGQTVSVSSFTVTDGNP